MERYNIKIKDIKDHKIHLIIKGIIIVDDYELSENPKKEEFEIDSWIPYKIIEDYGKKGTLEY